MEVLVSTAAKIGGYVLALIGRQPGYLIDYDSNMKTLKTQIEKLGDIKSGVQRSIEAAARNGEVIGADVERWLTTVNGINEELQRFLEDEAQMNPRCLSGWCPNLRSRYSLSRTAKKQTLVVIRLQGEGSFERVSSPAPPLGLEYMATVGVMDFESRKSIKEDIMSALKDDNISAIGICGMGGIGKTTMVKEVGKRAKVEQLFDEIVMAVVTQTPNLERIQAEIGDMLGLKFDEESLSGRARKLCKRLMEKRVLVILDDVWERLDLEAVGIPFGGDCKGCKVVLTSRNQDVCNGMKPRQNFTMGVLAKREAWNLFKEMAGNSINSPDLRSLAKEVVKECGGLPIAIVTVGRALENKNKHVWSDALRQLRMSSPENISGMQANVYRSLELSYTFLESQESKSCLLLCCIFEEDANIPVSDLVSYGMGLGLFNGIDALLEARDRVHTLVDRLKSCNLLLEGFSKEHVKMHDVVRDVIISIATKGKHAFMLRHDLELKEWPTQGMADKRSTSISLISNKTHELPDRLDCPKLELLLLACEDGPLEVPDILFERMKELKVLQLRRMFIPSPPTSLSFLTNLQTLYLHDCWLENVSVLGDLKALVILSFRGSSIEELPREIGKLTHLRLLDLTECRSLTKISPGVISCLIQLEELYMRDSSVQWEVEEGSKKRTNVNITELQSLSHLMALEIHLPTAKFLGSNTVLKNLLRFKISIGSNQDSYQKEKNQICNKLKFNFDARNPVENGINVLPKETEIIYLKGVKNVPNGLIRESLEHLKSLTLSFCAGPEYLIDTVDLVQHSILPILKSLKITDVHNLKKICHGQLPAGSFGELRFLSLHRIPELMHLWNSPTQLGNLTRMTVRSCDRLENLFSPSIARSLVQLYDLQIDTCQTMEEIVATERAEHGNVIANISFPKLSYLRLLKLPSIISFCKNMDEIEFPQLSNLILVDLPKMRSFCSNSLASDCNMDTATQHLFNEKVKSMCKLRYMKVGRCKELLNVYSSNVMQILHTLEELVVEDCDSLEVVFDFEGMNIDEEHAAVILTYLDKLKLSFLPKLTHIWKKNPPGIQGFQNLRLLEVVRCHSLEIMFSLSIAKLLVKLKTLHIWNCKTMKKIVGKDQNGREEDEEATKVIMFPKLSCLSLAFLPNFTNFCPESYSLVWPSLKKLSFNYRTIDTFVPAFLGAGNPRTINVRSHENLQDGYFNSSIQHHLFNEQVTFPNMEVLDLLGNDNAKWIVHGHLPAGSLCKLREMRVQECSKLLNVVPSNLLQRLQDLEGLTIQACASLEEVFEIDGLNVKEGDIVLLSKLKQLNLTDLPKLKHIWKREPKEFLYFQSLSVLRVCNCNSLRNLFSPSMTKSAEQLQLLEISECEIMTEIVAEDKGEDEKVIKKIVFPQLRCLILDKLPNLLSFFPKENSTASKVISTEKFIFNEKVVFPTLEELNLFHMNNWNEIWCSQLPTYSFTELKVLRVTSCDKLLRVAPFHLLKRLHNLEEVTAIGCDSLEEVFEFKGLSIEQGHAVMLPRLKKLTLDFLPKLMQICKKDHRGTKGFQNIKLLRVQDCGSLKNLFNPSMIRGLVHLEQLIISGCTMMEEIVAEGEEGKQEERMDKILIPQLKNLELYWLPNLTSFCQGFYAFDLPLLEDVSVYGCPRMKAFSFGFLGTPKLNKVEVGLRSVSFNRSYWMGDLNYTIHHLFERKDLVARGDDLSCQSSLSSTQGSSWKGKQVTVIGDVGPSQRHSKRLLLREQIVTSAPLPSIQEVPNGEGSTNMFTIEGQEVHICFL
ncbi:hypothetical protein L1049_007486 [Liquidambar formosana]|uniref:NB-ARC domain-containing protein n=1 Tax=Liquidambar formosana TaxID=63359 RepID=A0AAP0X3Z9_LIQFO